MHYISLTGKYRFLCFADDSSFVSLCPKMLSVRIGHVKVTSKAGKITARRQTGHRK